jgi:hypothetical protein
MLSTTGLPTIVATPPGGNGIVMEIGLVGHGSLANTRLQTEIAKKEVIV